MTAADRRLGAAEAAGRLLPSRLRGLAGSHSGATVPPDPSSHEPLADEADADLASRACRGDRLAFARLYERYVRTVHGVLLAVAPREEARDLVQEVFLIALRAIGRLEDPSSIGPWLLAIARNRARDAHKSRKPVFPMPEGMEPVAESASGPDGSGLEDEQEAARALDAVRSLPEAYRETLVLRLVEGLSGPEIAARTGMTHGSVRVNLHRGMKLLRERLSQESGR